LGAQIEDLKQAGLTDDQIALARSLFGLSPLLRSVGSIYGRRISKEEIEQLKEAGVTDEQIEKIREMFERPSLVPTMRGARLTMYATTLTKEQTPICPVYQKICNTLS
jgi:hypothetical protein